MYAISTVDGHLVAKVPVGAGPKGLTVWPLPGRYSLGHTGVLRTDPPALTGGLTGGG